MSDIEKMRAKLLGLPRTTMDLFNNIVRAFEAQLADEKKRADDIEESIRAIRASFPQQAARKFTTDIGTKG